MIHHEEWLFKCEVLRGSWVRYKIFMTHVPSQYGLAAIIEKQILFWENKTFTKFDF